MLSRLWRKSATLKSFPSASVMFCTSVSGDATATLFPLLLCPIRKTLPPQQWAISINTDGVPAFRRLLTTAQHKKLAKLSHCYSEWFFTETPAEPSSLLPTYTISLRWSEKLSIYGATKDLIPKCHNSAKPPLTWMGMVQAQILWKCTDKKKDFTT